MEIQRTTGQRGTAGRPGCGAESASVCAKLIPRVKCKKWPFILSRARGSQASESARTLVTRARPRCRARRCGRQADCLTSDSNRRPWLDARDILARFSWTHGSAPGAHVTGHAEQPRTWRASRSRTPQGGAGAFPRRIRMMRVASSCASTSPDSCCARRPAPPGAPRLGEGEPPWPKRRARRDSKRPSVVHKSRSPRPQGALAAMTSSRRAIVAACSDASLIWNPQRPRPSSSGQYTLISPDRDDAHVAGQLARRLNLVDGEQLCVAMPSSRCRISAAPPVVPVGADHVVRPDLSLCATTHSLRATG